jgi:hypothetical protein
VSDQPIAKYLHNSHIAYYGGYPKDGTLLYAKPVIQKPLSEIEVTKIAKDCNFDLTGRLLKFAREIEKAQMRVNDYRLASDIKAVK